MSKTEWVHGIRRRKHAVNLYFPRLRRTAYVRGISEPGKLKRMGACGEELELEIHERLRVKTVA